MRHAYGGDIPLIKQLIGFILIHVNKESIPFFFKGGSLAKKTHDFADVTSFSLAAINHEAGNGNALRPRGPTPFLLLEKGAKEHFCTALRQRED
jgi:hypothetical protein